MGPLARRVQPALLPQPEILVHSDKGRVKWKELQKAVKAKLKEADRVGAGSTRKGRGAPTY